jgi:hypothetical protein
MVTVSGWFELLGRCGSAGVSSSQLSLRRRVVGLAVVLCAVLAVVLVLLAVACVEALACSSVTEQARKASDSTSLADCRVYEMVSPADNDGPVGTPSKLGSSEGGGGLFVAVRAGGEVVFWESDATPPGTGAVPDGASPDTFRSVRTPTGWSTRDVLPYAFPYAGAGGEEPKVFLGASPDGSAVLVQTNAVLVAEDFEAPRAFYRFTQNSEFFIYRVSLDGAPVELVSHGEDPIPHPLTGFSFDGFASASPALRQVVFSSEEVYEEDYKSVGGVLFYFWDADEGHPVVHMIQGATGVAGVLGDGRPVVYPGPVVVDEPDVGGGGARTVLTGPGGGTFEAVMGDGVTAVLQERDPLVKQDTGVAGSDGNLYAISTGEGVPQSGLPLAGNTSAVICISCEKGSSQSGVAYVGMSEDGSHMFFTTTQGVGEALWSWDGHTATLLGEAGGFSHVVFSENGEYVLAQTSAARALREFAVGRAAVAVEGCGVPMGVSDDGQHVICDNTSDSLGIIDEWSTSGGVSQVSPLGSPNSYAVQALGGGELEDVFFFANEPIVPYDGNGGDTDIYDARSGGGFEPCTPGNPLPPAGAASCLPGSTQNPQPLPVTPYAAPLATPSFTLPALSTSTGLPGNGPKKGASRAQQLASALKACGRQPRKRRAACERLARKRYGPSSKNSRKATNAHAVGRRKSK